MKIRATIIFFCAVILPDIALSKNILVEYQGHVVDPIAGVVMGEKVSGRFLYNDETRGIFDGNTEGLDVDPMNFVRFDNPMQYFHTESPLQSNRLFLDQYIAQEDNTYSDSGLLDRSTLRLEFTDAIDFRWSDHKWDGSNYGYHLKILGGEFIANPYQLIDSLVYDKNTMRSRLAVRVDLKIDPGPFKEIIYTAEIDSITFKEVSTTSPIQLLLLK